MIRTAVPSRAIRRGAGALTAVAALAAGATVAATSADAATTVSATAHPAYAVGQTATVTVTDSGGTHPAYYAGSAAINGTSGTAVSGTTFTATKSTAGAYGYTVFDDVNTDGKFETGEPSTTVTLNFVVPTITLSPPTTAATTGSPVQMTLTASTASGVPLPDVAIAVAASQPVGYFASNPLGLTTQAGTATGNRNSPGLTRKATDTTSFTTDGNGTAVFFVGSTATGTITVDASADGSSAESQVTVSKGSTQPTGPAGDNNVAFLAVTPSAQQAYAGAKAFFTITAEDSTGKPVNNATVYYTVASGGPDASATPVKFGATNSTGQLTGGVTNDGVAGTDQLTFFVNHTTGVGTHSPGLDNGEPSTSASAAFTSAPAATSLSLGAANKNIGAGTNPVQFSATLLNGTQPVPNAIVTFALSGATQSTLTAATNASGVATIEATPTTSASGRTISATASYPNVASATQNDNFVAPIPQSLTLSPVSQTLAKGAAVSVAATLVDQFGHGVANATLNYTVSGRNSTHATATTNSSGVATIHYTDAAAATSTATTDTISVSDPNTTVQAKTATVTYLLGTTTATTISLSQSPIGTHVVTTGWSTSLGAVVKNERGEPLSGKSITFTVSSGFVGGSSASSTTSTATYTTTTDANGNAIAYIGSTKAGSQTISVTSGAATVTTSGVYTAGVPAAITINPPTVTAAQGATPKFTATVADQFGNPIANQVVAFTAAGSGTINGGSTQTVTTGTDGTAAVVVAIPSSAANGASGSVTAVDDAISPASANHASATYLVSSAAPGGTAAPSRVRLTPRAGTVGSIESVGVEVDNSTGQPLPNVVVHYAVTGANRVSGTNATNTHGKATISYSAKHAGTDTVVVYADSNGNGQLDSGEPQASTTVRISGVEKPSLTLSSNVKHVLRVVAHTNPKLAQADVNFYSVSASGKRKLIGSAMSGPKGNATFVWRGLKSGHVYKVQARVVNTGSLTQQYSAARSHKVK